jgi:glutathione S-transferase
MKLFYSPFHTFIDKVLVTAHEAGLWDEITFVPTYRYKNRKGEDQGDRYSIAALNPLDKVPTLALDSGQVIYGSQSVVEYLDSIGTSGKRLYPPEGPERWDALVRMALCDTIFESTVMLVMEGRQPEEKRRMQVFDSTWPKIIRGFDSLEDSCRRGFARFDIGQASMLHAISYLAYRIKLDDPGHPIYARMECFDKRPHLRAWWDEAIQRPSVKSHYNVPFEGDESIEFLRRIVEEVLAAQVKST